MDSVLVRLGLAAALVLAGASARAQVFNPETFTLPNGLQVVLVENHRAPVVTQMVWYRIGSADEKQGKSGIAHFLEHLMFKGTKNVPAGDFSKTVARNGGRDNAFTYFDYTGYFQNIARDRLELVMRLESDRMTGLVLTDTEVNPEREVILEERRMRTDGNPRARLGEQAQAAMFLNHPYGRPVIGWEHEMRGLTTQDALDWYRTYYAPNNAILVVSGDVTMAELRPLAEKYYGPIPAHPIPERVRPQEPPPGAARRVELKDARVRQVTWSRSYIAPSYLAGETKHADPLTILAEVLGGGVTSRLYQAMVLDKPIATGAGAGYETTMRDLSTFDLSASLRPDAQLADLEAAVDAEIQRVLENGVTDAEVQRAKERMRSAAVYARDGLQGGARSLGEVLAIGGTIDLVEKWPQRIAAVTTAQVNEAARAVLREDGSVTAVLSPKPGS